jgi:hypothetical protein
VHTEECGKEDESHERQPFQVLEYLAVKADQGGYEEHGEETDRQPGGRYVSVAKGCEGYTHIVVTRLKSGSKATAATMG